MPERVLLIEDDREIVDLVALPLRDLGPALDPAGERCDRLLGSSRDSCYLRASLDAEWPAELHGSRLEVERHGRGSLFHFLLP
jgi:hypothetical protein